MPAPAHDAQHPPAVPPPPPVTLQYDEAVVWHAMCVLLHPTGATQLRDLIHASGLRTRRGTAFTLQVIDHQLAQLSVLRLVQGRAHGKWQVDRRLGERQFVQLIADQTDRQRWWRAWCRLHRFDNASYLTLSTAEDWQCAIRLVVYAARSTAAYDRLQWLARTLPWPWTELVSQSLLAVFDGAAIDALEPEFRELLLVTLAEVNTGIARVAARPFWQWLLAREASRQAHASTPDTPAATSTAAIIAQRLRLLLAQRRLFEGDTQDARRLLADAVVPALVPRQQALRAASDIVDGRYAAGAQAFEAALKLAAVAEKRRKNLLPNTLLWFYALALLACREPSQWVAARKFCSAEMGGRHTLTHHFWKRWQIAIDQRLGELPLRVADIVDESPADPHLMVHFGPPPQPDLQQLSQWLLAAWLGHRPRNASTLRPRMDAAVADWQASGQHWLAMMARRCRALLLEQPTDAADAAQPFPLAERGERWREALQAIVALDSPAQAAAGSSEGIVWLLSTNAADRVVRIEARERKIGPRGPGKLRAVSLATLCRRPKLLPQDSAVLRTAVKLPYGPMKLDHSRALMALVRHPRVAWSDAPDEFIEIDEGLPRLEVLTRDEHLQFKVLDPITPEDALSDADGDEVDDDYGDPYDDGFDDDDDDFDRLRPDEAGAVASHETLLLVRDEPQRARLVRVSPAQLRVAELVNQGWRVPVGARTEIDAALRVLSNHFTLASDAEAGQEVPSSAVLRAELTPFAEGLELHLVSAPFGDFGPRPPPGQGRMRVTTVHQGVTLSTQRDLARERLHQRRLTDAIDWLDDGANRWRLDDPAQALAVVEALGTLAPDIIAEWPKGKALRVRTVSPAQLTLKVSGRGDWLALDGELAVDGDEALRLHTLLDLARNARSRYVALREGEYLALTESLRRQLADLHALASPAGRGGDALRLSPVAALAWSAQADAPTLHGNADWRQRVERWAQCQTQQFAVPAGLRAELRDYQVLGWQWLARLAASGFGALLADDMGLGKTLQTLALLLARADGGPALVVAPTSVAGNWLAEAARFAPSLRTALYGVGRNAEDTVALADEAGDDPDPASSEAAESASAASSARLAARRAQLQAAGAHDVLVCSWALLQRDAALLTARPWHTVVLDEAQAIKNAATARARAAFALSAQARVALTGTPVENRLAELWAVMAFANPGLLGSADQFQQRFAGPIERASAAAQTQPRQSTPQVTEQTPAPDDHGAANEARRRLRRLVSPFLLRRTKSEVLADLPPRTEIVHRIVPGSRERALHEALRRQAEADLQTVMQATNEPGQAQMHILAALTRLRRAACDPRLAAPELGLVGAKVQAFEQLALELREGQHKALVFSQFTDFLALLRERLDACGLRYQYLDGSTPQAQRMRRVDAFQAGDGDFFLISLKAGGFGLNLTMADYVIITDPWWNPAAEDQASGRAHRIGQQRPVTVYRLVTAGTIEDRIVQLHQHKRGLADSVLSGQDSAGATLGAAELLALLRDDDGVGLSADDVAHQQQ